MLILSYLETTYTVRYHVMPWVREGTYLSYCSNSSLRILANVSGGKRYGYLKSGSFVKIQGLLCLTLKVLSRDVDNALVKVNVTIFNITKISCPNAVKCSRNLTKVTYEGDLLVNLHNMIFNVTSDSYRGFFNFFINPQISSTIREVLTYRGPCDGVIQCYSISRMHILKLDEIKNTFTGTHRIYLNVIKEYGNDMKCDYLGTTVWGSISCYDARGILKWILLPHPASMYSSDVLYSISNISIIAPSHDIKPHKVIIYLVNHTVGN
ncbi:MAG: hypothetical protein DRO18_01230 [Thermoprotei archaeon]|nr:MAG: hypothetical protein DRO18_01230 [Thermoprotei archaeon]